MTIAMNAENLFTPVSIFDVGGEEGESAFILSLEEALGRDEFSKIDPISLSNFKQSFILNRHHGNWRLKSSLEYNDEKISVPIAYKPSKDLVVYDELPLNWSEIKQRVPQAKDAFWAPGNSFLLVKTSKYLMIYGITEKGLTDSPLQRVEIDENEEIIMAEWARGDFVSRWTTVVSKIGQRIIFVQN